MAISKQEYYDAFKNRLVRDMRVMLEADDEDLGITVDSTIEILEQSYEKALEAVKSDEKFEKAFPDYKTMVYFTKAEFVRLLSQTDSNFIAHDVLDDYFEQFVKQESRLEARTEAVKSVRPPIEIDTSTLSKKFRK